MKPICPLRRLPIAVHIKERLRFEAVAGSEQNNDGSNTGKNPQCDPGSADARGLFGCGQLFAVCEPAGGSNAKPAASFPISCNFATFARASFARAPGVGGRASRQGQ